ncbi:MAG: 3-oxoacyl-ACP reductase FabG [Acidobacteria bacterium]|nr:3-oxoacyl-ACP reductase FabG [Acidobacteriota bacterium]
MIDLGGKRILVTGGSRGIGRACCELAARAGARVAIGYRLERAAAEALVRSIVDAGGEAHCVAAELADRGEAEMLVEDAAERFGGLDVLINNHGIWKGAPIDEMSDGEWNEMIGINLTGVFHVIRAAVPHLKAAGGGSIVNLSSTAGQRGEAGHSHYAATKGAIISMTKSLAVELAPHGIRTNCVAPGWVDTDMSHETLVGPRAEEIRAAIPLGRPGTAEEIAGAVLFLASPLAAFINGEILNVNGGSVLCG